MVQARVVVAPNWIGDSIMAIPFLRALARSHPEDRLAIIARRGPASIFRAQGSAKEVLVRSWMLRDAANLRRGGFDEAWLLPNSFRAALLARVAGIPSRIGYASDGRGALLTHSLAPAPRAGHQLHDYDPLLISRQIVPDREPPRLPIPESAAVRAQACWRQIGWTEKQPVAMLAPGAAYGWTKRWPAQRFGLLADSLEQRGMRCAVVIGPGEEEIGKRASQASRRGVPVVGTDLDPVELAALLARARVVVANDSGPMHLAAAVGTPVVAFFGPTDPGRTAPTGSPSRVLDRYVFCSPCFLKACPYGHECMKEIGVEDAARAVEELLRMKNDDWRLKI